MRTAIVIPCLNEERSLSGTARSLGFAQGHAKTPANTSLVLVDNGSKDDTPSIMQEIREASRPGSVQLIHESERGYVPPRHAGVLAAWEDAKRQGVSADRLLLLQADADTKYEPDYLLAMRATADQAGPGTLFEGGAHPPDRFLTRHPGFQRLADAVDASVAPYLVSDAEDVVVDDKVAGFTADTYFRWGGHRREYTNNGAEIHAETARLFIRGKMLGGTKTRVVGAFAQPSRRKILRNPIRHFVTAGFPREDAWWRKWSAAYSGPRDMLAFEDSEAVTLMDAAVSSRKAHLLVLFAALPIYLGRSFHPEVEEAALHPVLAHFLRGLGSPLNDNDLGPLFGCLFEMLDAWTPQLQAVGCTSSEVLRQAGSGFSTTSRV